MASPISIAPSIERNPDASPSPPIQRAFDGSRPPSPSLFGRINLEKVNEKLRFVTRRAKLSASTDPCCRERTATPPPRTVERFRQQALDAFDELIGVGGIPLRPWTDSRVEDLTDAQRANDDGEEHLIEFYFQEETYWLSQMKLWKRFAKRRGIDGQPDLRSLTPIDAVTAFIAYMRLHLEMDLKDRDIPGCQRWPNSNAHSHQRWFIFSIVELLPAVEGLLRRLRAEAGDETAMDGPEVTVEDIKKEYNIPPPGMLSMYLWEHRQASAPLPEPVELDMSFYKPHPFPIDRFATPPLVAEPLQPLKRRRSDGDEGDENDEDARPSKRRVSNSKSHEQSEKQSPALQQDAKVDSPEPTAPSVAAASRSGKARAKRGKLKQDKKSALKGHPPRQASGTGRAKAAKKMTAARDSTRQSQRASAREAEGSVTNATGLRRSARIAAGAARSK